MAYRKYLSNDTHASGFGGAWEHIHYYSDKVEGSVTADQADRLVFIAPVAGSIVTVIGAEEANGADASNPLTMAFTVKKNGTAVATTDPAITKAAASNARVSTAASGTGITQVALKTDGTADFVAGDHITVTFDITRTASPSNEITTPSVVVGVKFSAA